MTIRELVMGVRIVWATRSPYWIYKVHTPSTTEMANMMNCSNSDVHDSHDWKDENGVTWHCMGRDLEAGVTFPSLMED